MLDPYRSDEIRRVAADLFDSLSQARTRSGITASSPTDLFPLDVRLIASVLLRVRFEEPDEIVIQDAADPLLALRVQTAGFIDRVANRIVVAQRFPIEWRRFTGAHEIGHWLLHPAMTYHRDRPLKGGERANPARPTVEQEADVFAAELLMPPRTVRREFFRRFDRTIKGRSVDDEVNSWLAQHSGRPDDRPQVAGADRRRYRAMLVAGATSFRGRQFVSLARHFGVSVTAMAIQLDDLNLVI